ncbi:hypothetical protein MRX96_007259 [Rhipicephalus microplus]
MAVPAEPATAAVIFGYINVAYNKRQIYSLVGGKGTVAVMQPVVSIYVRRVARAIVNAGTRNKWVHFPRTAEEMAAAKEEFFRFFFVAEKRGSYSSWFSKICVADMPNLTVDPLCPGLDDDSHICVGPRI